MANLSGQELLKPGREYRSSVVVRKLAEGSDFEMTGNKKVKLVPDPKVIKVLNKSTKTATELNALVFTDASGKSYKLSDMVKTSEFGGKGERGSVAKEDAALSDLNKQIEKAKAEIGYATIPIKIGRKTYQIDRAESTPGTPKSDFHLLDASGKEVVWISHKDGRSARDFQQWGGISQKSEPGIYAHKETQKFISDLKKKYPNGLPPATSLYRKINDDKVKMFSVYGNQYGSSMGRQNVTILLQGPITLSKSGSFYKLGANQVHVNGESVDSDGFEPVFMAIYKGDRSDAGVKGTRIVIAPVGGRKANPF
jgi:hypothetical protein